MHIHYEVVVTWIPFYIVLGLWVITSLFLIQALYMWALHLGQLNRAKNDLAAEKERAGVLEHSCLTARYESAKRGDQVEKLEADHAKLLGVVGTYIDLRNNHPQVAGEGWRDLVGTYNLLKNDSLVEVLGWPAIHRRLLDEHAALLEKVKKEKDQRQEVPPQPQGEDQCSTTTP